MPRPFTIAALVVVVSALGAAGCEATFVPAPPAVAVAGGVAVRVNRVPAEVGWAPRVRYADGWAYLVDGVWYLATPNGWFAYRREPTELWRQRRSILSGRQPRRAPPPPGLAFPPR